MSRRPGKLIRGFRGWLQAGYPGLASQIAFYFLLSIFPGILLLSTLLTFFPDCPDYYLDVRLLLRSLLPPLAAELVDDLIQGTNICRGAESGAFSFSLIILVLAGSNVFAVMSRAMNRAYGIEETRTFVRRRLLAIAFFIGTIITTAMAFPIFVLGSRFGQAAADVFRISPSVAFWELALIPVVSVISMSGLTALYKYGPDWRVRIRNAARGALVTMLGALVVSIVFRTLIANLDNFESLHGALAAPIILMIWMYLLAFVLLLGGVVVAVLEGHTAPGRK